MDHESFAGRPICPNCGYRTGTVFGDVLACLELCGAFWTGTGDEMRRATLADKQSESAAEVYEAEVAARLADARTLDAMSPRVREANERLKSRKPTSSNPGAQLSLV